MSWRTTLCGVGTILLTIGAGMLALFDDDPQTVFDLTAAISALTTALIGMGLLAARDNSVTSEQAKAGGAE